MLLETVAEVFIVTEEEEALDLDLQTPVQSPNSFLETAATAAEDKENLRPEAGSNNIQGLPDRGDIACELCAKVFVSLDYLKAHSQEDHPQNPFPPPSTAEPNIDNDAEGVQHKCETCGKYFISREKLEEHKQDTHSEKAFSCATCRKTFSRSHHLKIHMRGHTGDRPYACSVCQKVFVDNSGLRSHARIHAEERTYRCLACDKCFKTRRNLRQHELKHASTRPFTCRQCGKSFTFKRNLERHVETHASAAQEAVCEERALSQAAVVPVPCSSSSSSSHMVFKCLASNCGKVFSTEEQVRAHRDLVHATREEEGGLLDSGEGPVSCSTCGVTFGNVKTLR